MTWQQGQSGNPGGRPKGHGSIRELARQHTDAAVNTLVEIAERGKSESARVAAAVALLDRGWGKATQHLAADPDAPIVSPWQVFEQLKNVSDAELSRAYADLIAGNFESASISNTNPRSPLDQSVAASALPGRVAS